LRGRRPGRPRRPPPRARPPARRARPRRPLRRLRRRLRPPAPRHRALPRRRRRAWPRRRRARHLAGHRPRPARPRRRVRLAPGTPEARRMTLLLFAVLAAGPTSDAPFDALCDAQLAARASQVPRARAHETIADLDRRIQQVLAEERRLDRESQARRHPLAVRATLDGAVLLGAALLALGAWRRRRA